MILMIEIALMVWVWNRGWRHWALLPFCITLGVSFLVGAFFGATGADPSGLLYLLLLDVALIITLVAMGLRGYAPYGEMRGSLDAGQGRRTAV